MDYPNIRLRDPYFIAAVDKYVAFEADGRNGEPRAGMPPPPALTPHQIGGLHLANRAVAVQPAVYSAIDGLPNDDHHAALAQAATTGAALVITQSTAISTDGRVTTGCPGMYAPDHIAAWTDIVVGVGGASGARLCVSLGHAGVRAGSRPRSEGVDVPSPDSNGRLAASAYSYARNGPVARAMDRDDMDRARNDFVRAARWAADAGFDMVQLDMAHGHLLAGFISPVTNRRDDDYGGPFEHRVRFPLEVLRAVREAIGATPIAVAICASDEVRNGSNVDSAVATARAFKDAGCDLIVVTAGQTIASSKPSYDSYTMTFYSDRIRNEAGIPTLVQGNIQTMDQVSTIIAGGRADLCRMIHD
jgi:anthraniloyl-CoA monooxygenase